MRKKLQHWALIFIYGSILWFGWIDQVEASRELSQVGIRHILSRLSFGISSEQMHQVKTKGIEAYIQSQLNPQLISESPILDNYLVKLDSIEQKPIKLQQKILANRKKLKNTDLSVAKKEQIQKEIQELRREFNIKVSPEVIDAHLARAIYSNRQLQEVMVDFWLNHFNVFFGKKAVGSWLSDYEDVIRANSLGNFRDLLGSIASHPAMLIYLDNKLNTAPNSPGARGKYKGLNENYARELMELHTLGLEGGYTQNDVVALARIFTGWTEDYQAKEGDENGFFFDENRHDHGDKVFLGHKIPADGMEEGKQALDILATHPATANFISYKLAQYFVADQPPSTLVDLMTQKFLDSHGNIKVVLDTLIHSQEFNSSEYYQQKFKTPYQYLISLIRMSEIQQPDFNRIKDMLNKLSMPIYGCIPPTGYKNTQDAWLNPQAILQRIDMATKIANGALNRDYPVKYQRLKDNLGSFSQHTKQVIAKNSPKLRSALILGSPEAMYR